MSVKFISDHCKDVTCDDIKNMTDKALAALDTLHNKTGEGNDFLGWVTLPSDYDKEEFARIKKAA